MSNEEKCIPKTYIMMKQTYISLNLNITVK